MDEKQRLLTRRTVLTLAGVGGGSLLAGCSARAPGRRTPDPDTSTTAPVSDGFESAASYSRSHRGDAVLVFADDSLVYETYRDGYRSSRPHLLASGTKTFCGVMAVAAVEDGHFGLDDRVASIITEWETDEQKRTITIRQLLNLTSGLKTTVGKTPSFEAALSLPLVHTPGEEFRYGPSAFQVFGALLQRTLDGEDPTSYLQRRILEPIDVTVGRWGRVDGDPQLAGGAWMTAQNWLRFGRLLLGDGSVDGTRVLGRGLRETLTTASSVAPAYGVAVWLNTAVSPESDFVSHAPLTVDGPNHAIYDTGPDDLFMAAGAANQRLYVVPSRELVVLRFGRADPRWDDGEFLSRLL